MNLETINFDDFMSYDHKIRRQIINDPELLKIMVRKNIKEKRYLHSLSVAVLAKELALCHHVDPEKAYIAGLLHDVIEDTKYTLQDIADKGAERDVVEALSLLTHKKNQPYSEYLDRIIDSNNPIAIAVKKNDLLDNLARNDKATEAKQRIFEKHSRAIERLMAEG